MQQKAADREKHLVDFAKNVSKLYTPRSAESFF